MEKSFNSIAWREAATGGFYMGLTYAILAIAGHLMRSHTGVASLAGALGFFSIAGFLYFYSSRMAALRGAAGFSFGQSMAFVLRMSLFAGILGGLGMFVLYKWIDPEFFRQQMEPGDRDLRGKRMGRESGRVGRYDRGENDGEPALRRVQRRGYDDYLRRTARPDRIVVRQTPRRPVRRCEQRTKRHDAPAIRIKTTARC